MEIPLACSVLFLLREGVERFLITDINNPAASAMAQSEVWIMLDQIGTGATVERGRRHHHRCFRLTVYRA